MEQTSMLDLPRLMVAAPASGSGKTAVTCALLRTFQRRGLAPCAFKCGPDYIDPMFHREVLSLPSRNLDLFFSTEEQVYALLARGGKGRGVAVLEGVMGLYDGVAGTDRASSWHLARCTGTPVLLVLEPKGAALTLAAMVKGLQEFRTPNQLGGILLNRCASSLYRYLSPILQQETGLPVLGYLPNLPQCAIPSRHLGLVTAEEIEDLQHKIDELARQLEQTVDVGALLELARQAAALSQEEGQAQLPPDGPVVAVARDRAFCFYYQENLDLLERLGAKLRYFSPLEDGCLPLGTSGVYLGGGYPELYARRLSENSTLLSQLCQAVGAGMPVIAECGGFLYLQRELADQDGTVWPMAGVLAGRGYPTGRLQRFGYATLTARRDTPFLHCGESIAAHEFHRWDCTQLGDACLSRRAAGGEGQPCMVSQGNLLAGFPHLYFPSAPDLAARFVELCTQWKENCVCP